MNIEMAESLVQSYFKHVKGCFISQTDWKLSGNWKASDEGKQKCEALFGKIKDDAVFGSVFKMRLEQVLKQSEIDIVGIDANNTIYFAEVAFHENGLSFGNEKETQEIFAKKMLRAYLVGLYLFPKSKYEIIFATPRIVPAAHRAIIDIFSELKKRFECESVHFQYIADEAFRNEILLPTCECTQGEAVDSELFIRSTKLLSLFDISFTSKHKRRTPCLCDVF